MAADGNSPRKGKSRIKLALAQREAELALINSIQLALASRMNVQSIYDLVGDKIREIFNAQVVMISTYDPETNSIEHKYAIEKGERVYAPGKFPIRGFRTKIVKTKKPVLASSHVAEQAARLGQPTLPGTITPKTWLGVPMLVGQQVTGILSLQNIEEEFAFSESDVRLLQTLAASMSVALENARLWEKEKKYLTALEHELDIGRNIQAGFLPSSIPQPKGWEIAAVLQPAREVAGDFFDIFELPEDQIGLVIADVCDKGLGAALFMTLFRSFVRVISNFTEYSSSQTINDKLPSERLMDSITVTNKYIFDNHGNTGMFATIFFGILNTKSGILTYINGGHLPPFIINPQGKKETLMVTGPGVGVVSDANYATQEISIQPGELLFACTDGLTDPFEGNYYDSSIIGDLIKLNAEEQSVKMLLDKVSEKVNASSKGKRQMDDFTILACRRSK
jgi:serine phosphatase RsbU (regulator of sigma subunit)